MKSTNSLGVSLRYFLDCNHAFLVEIERSKHDTVCSVTKHNSVAPLIIVIGILIHTNISLNFTK